MCDDTRARKARECMKCISTRPFKECTSWSLWRSDCDGMSPQCKSCLNSQSGKLVSPQNNPCADACDCRYYVPASSSNDASCCRSPPVDCKMGEWGAWSQCGAGGNSGQETRTRRILVRDSFYGSPCGGKQETRKCGQDFCRDNGFRSAYDCATCVLKDSKHAKEKCADSRGLLFVNDCSGMNDACRACLRGGGGDACLKDKSKCDCPHYDQTNERCCDGAPDAFDSQSAAIECNGRVQNGGALDCISSTDLDKSKISLSANIARDLKAQILTELKEIASAFMNENMKVTEGTQPDSVDKQGKIKSIKTHEPESRPPNALVSIRSKLQAIFTPLSTRILRTALTSVFNTDTCGGHSFAILVLLGTGVGVSYFVGVSGSAAAGFAIGCDGKGPVMQMLWEWEAQVEVGLSGFHGGKFKVGGLTMEIAYLSDWTSRCCADLIVGAMFPEALSHSIPLIPAHVGLITSNPEIQKANNCGHINCPWAIGFGVHGFYGVYSLVHSAGNAHHELGVFAGLQRGGLVGPLIAVDIQSGTANPLSEVATAATATAGGVAFVGALVAISLRTRKTRRQKLARKMGGAPVSMRTAEMQNFGTNPHSPISRQARLQMMMTTNPGYNHSSGTPVPYSFNYNNTPQPYQPNPNTLM